MPRIDASLGGGSVGERVVMGMVDIVVTFSRTRLLSYSRPSIAVYRCWCEVCGGCVEQTPNMRSRTLEIVEIGSVRA